MTRQSSLFNEDPAVATPSPPGVQPAGSGLALAALKFASGALSAEQRRFNQLLERTDMLAGRIEAVRGMADTHRTACATTLRPVEEQRHALMRDMALWLDGRLKQPGLTRKQQQLASKIICDLASGLALTGMEDMRALHDVHSDASLADQEKASASDAQAFLEKMLGEAVGSDREFTNPEEVLQAGMEQIRRQAQAHEQARAAHQAKRAKSKGKKQTEQQAQDAEGALRLIYRQLASALHPDRETNPAEHARKTALMSDANAAYARRDLLALLQLQLRCELADARKVSTLAKERIAALSMLLKERAEVMARELSQLEAHLRDEFNLPPYLPLSAPGLRRHLQEQKQDLQDEIAMMRKDLRLVRVDADFKRWLRDQRRLAREDASFDDFFR